MVMTRYEQLAQQIREQIQNRVWRAGDKLPSLRESGKRAGLSLMTVVQSYQLLESQGWIVARPQSGYYVAARPQPLPQPSRGEKLLLSEQVDINAFIFDVLQACKDPDIVPFGSAFPDATLFAQPKLARALSSVARKFTPHSSLANLPPGNDALRRHIAQRYALSGMQVAPDEIVITAGAMESLSLSLQAVTQPGDYVAIESPAFYGALQALERLRLKAVAIATHPQDGIDLDALQQAVEQYPIKACWLMTHFQNPQGATLPEANKQRLVELLRERQISLIEDDVYGELYFSAERPLPAKALDSGGQILHCSSFSKCLAPGFRVGWVAAGRYAQQIQRLQLMSTVSTSVPTQMALADYLLHGIHSTYSDNLLMLTLSRGGPIVWLSEDDAKDLGIADNDWIEAFNANGALTARAVVSQRIPAGMTMMYHAQERIVNLPGSEITSQRGGIHNSVTRACPKPTHMIGGYAQLAYGFNYYGTVGSNRDEFVVVRKMNRIDWLDDEGNDYAQGSQQENSK